jgi:membrane protein implicated in regulation of membrane protease activity
MVFLLILLLIAAAAGVLGAVLKAVLWLTLTIVLTIVVVGWIGWWAVKRQLRRASAGLDERHTSIEIGRPQRDDGPPPSLDDRY